MIEYLRYLREKYLPRHCGIRAGTIVDYDGEVGVLKNPWIDKCGQVLVAFVESDSELYVSPHKLEVMSLEDVK